VIQYTFVSVESSQAFQIAEITAGNLHDELNIFQFDDNYENKSESDEDSSSSDDCSDDE